MTPRRNERSVRRSERSVRRSERTARAVGPAPDADWERLAVPDPPPEAVLWLPDDANAALVASGAPPVRYALPERPLLATGPDGDPVLSLTLLLERQPSPGDAGVRHLIRDGVLSFDASLALPALSGDGDEGADDADEYGVGYGEHTGGEHAGGEHAGGEHADKGAIPDTDDADYRPLYARSVRFELLGGREKPSAGESRNESEDEGESASEDESERPVLAAADATGPAASASLQASLDRTGALAVLAALRGDPTDLGLRAAVRYRVAATDRRVALGANWAAVHDFLSPRMGDGSVDRTTLRRLFGAMVEQEVVTVEPVGGEPGGGAGTTYGGGAGHGPDRPAHVGDSAGSAGESAGRAGRSLPPGEVDDLFDAFLAVSAVVLREESGRYRLRGRPHPAYDLEYVATVTGDGERTVTGDGDLSAVLGGALSGRDPDAFVRLVSPAGDSRGGVAGTGVGPVPRRTRTGPSRGARGAGGELALTTTAAGVHSVSLLSNPAVAASAVKRRPAPDGIGTEPEIPPIDVPDDVVVDPVPEPEPEPDPPPPPPPEGPLVEDRSAAVWPDARHDDRYWYPPTFRAVEASAADDPDSGPFSFDYEVTGVTGEGGRGVEATVRVELRQGVSEETSRALARRGDPGDVRPVPTGNLSASLWVPYREGGDWRIRRVPATVERDGDRLQVTAEVVDDWARVCYGGLAFPHGDRSVEVVVGYSFRGVVEVGDARLAGARTAAVTPVRYAPDEPPGDPVYFDAPTATLHAPGGSFRLARTVAERRGERRGAGQRRGDPEGRDRQTPRRVANGGVARADDGTTDRRARGETAVASAVADLGVVHRPVLKAADAKAVLGRQRRYGTRTVGQSVRVAARYPCEETPDLYRRVEDGEATAIGCRESLDLAAPAEPRYEEVTDLRAPTHRVFRSPVQPGRFLVVPATYRIGRHPPGSALAYRPAATAYTVFGGGDREADRFVFDAGLSPDLPPFVRHRLREDLRARLPDGREPTLAYPTEEAADVSFAWNVSAFVDDPVVVPTADGYRVTVETDLPDGLLLERLLGRDGVAGHATFALPDGSEVGAGLALALDHMTGPFGAGAVEAERVDGEARLTNRVEAPLAVSELEVAGDDGATIPVETTLEPGDTTTVSLSGAGGDDSGTTGDLLAVYAHRPGGPTTLAEARVFLEDVRTNVVFASQVNFDRHDLDHLSVRAGLRGVEGAQTVPLSGDPPVGSATFTLPLTAYLRSKVLEYQVTKTFRSGETETTPWLEWDVEGRGTIVNLTWEVIA